MTNDLGNSLTAIDPRTGRRGRTIPVEDPYNMYFTPEGQYAIVVAERLARLDFRDAHRFRLHRSLALPCRGVDHADFRQTARICSPAASSRANSSRSTSHESAFAARSTFLGTRPRRMSSSHPTGGFSTSLTSSPAASGKSTAAGCAYSGSSRTGAGAHGLYVSRDDRYLYVTNRSAGSISVLSFSRQRIVATWRIPGGSPDMGNVSADGKVLWLSGRYDAEVYAISTRDGRLLARIRVGAGPHGLCVWPQPGRYSLGHTGILR